MLRKGAPLIGSLPLVLRPLSFLFQLENSSERLQGEENGRKRLDRIGLLHKWLCGIVNSPRSFQTHCTSNVGTFSSIQDLTTSSDLTGAALTTLSVIWQQLPSGFPEASPEEASRFPAAEKATSPVERPQLAAFLLATKAASSTASMVIYEPSGVCRPS